MRANYSEALGQVMIRNRRSDGGVEFTKRYRHECPTRLSPEEMALYQGVTDYVRKHATAENGDLRACFRLSPLQREVCSSRDAVFITLVNLFKKTTEDSPLRARIWELVELDS